MFNDVWRRCGKTLNINAFGAKHANDAGLPLHVPNRRHLETQLVDVRVRRFNVAAPGILGSWDLLCTFMEIRESGLQLENCSVPASVGSDRKWERPRRSC